MMLSLLLFSIPIIPRADKEKLAEDYYKSYIISYYSQYNSFPNSLPTLAFYVPFSYYKDTDKAIVRLFGKDRKPNTSDDIVLTFTRTELDKKKYSITKRRARVLEQALYSDCQRRLARGITPIYPSSLSELLNDADLPSWYRYDGFGKEFIYDTSSCHPDYCYCEEVVIKTNSLTP